MLIINQRMKQLVFVSLVQRRSNVQQQRTHLKLVFEMLNNKQAGGTSTQTCLREPTRTSLGCNQRSFPIIVVSCFFDGPSSFLCVSPKAESFGVSAQTGSGVVRGGPEGRFHEGSTRVPRGFHDSTRFCEGCGVVRALKEHRLLLGISPELIWCLHSGHRPLKNKKRCCVAFPQQLNALGSQPR